MNLYLLLKLDKTTMEIIAEIQGEEERQAVKGVLKFNTFLVKVNSFEEGRAMVDVHNKVAPKPKAPLNIQVFSKEVPWNWSLVSKEIQLEFIRLFQNESWKEIMILHNKYKLTDVTYCCPEFIPLIQQNMKLLTDKV